MLRILSDFPDDVLAVSASGEITAADYRDILLPAIHAKLAGHKPLRVFYEIGPDFTGMQAGAMWEDAKLGFGHLGDLGRAAVVTDVGWIATSMRLFAPLMRQPVRIFPLARREEARRWLLEET